MNGRTDAPGTPVGAGWPSLFDGGEKSLRKLRKLVSGGASGNIDVRVKTRQSSDFRASALSSEHARCGISPTQATSGRSLWACADLLS